MNSTERKDIILIVGGGGMAGVFATGALEVISEQARDRVRAVYATSSGADAAVYFVSDQAWFPPRFFKEYLTRPGFINGNLISYLYKVFVLKGHSARIPDFVNVDYFIDAAQSSECPFDAEAFERSGIEFFVKVVDIDSAEVSYLSTHDRLPEKLVATSQCGPFSTVSVELSGKRYIDGGTLISSLDADLARSSPDTKFIYIESSGPRFLRTALLYPCYVLAAAALARLYGARVGWRYLCELFTDETEALKGLPNVFFVRNSLDPSTFTTDRAHLERMYIQGREEAKRVLLHLER
jgi:predicted patatin/cPLA2 family phospholipase